MVGVMEVNNLYVRRVVLKLGWAVVQADVGGNWWRNELKIASS